MQKRLDTLRQYADIFGKGLTREIAPEIAAGMMLELFQRWQINVAAITREVTKNRSLWDRLDQSQRSKLKKAARRIGNLNWATADWFINAIKRDYPAVASLILGWPEAYTWLENQVEDLKKLLLEDDEG